MIFRIIGSFPSYNWFRKEVGLDEFPLSVGQFGETHAIPLWTNCLDEVLNSVGMSSLHEVKAS